ncbi:DUF6252 family protein [Flavobacterium pallidum]|uniref:Lipocalin-like domain-containing protein n=1 Tax=Flavobacterium pallidum TaxID=2172098 RepID=A0A2S1SDX9_9FLAO|nr:DUF6252 family protein [Flavobacterium pallidum]AWI24572.1 hypothetical protein HYN49_00940 [Flavobacterium pallidum]
MKTFKKIGLTALMALALVFNSCSSDSDGGGSSSLSTYISAKVDGTSFETASIQGQSVGVAMKQGTGDMQLITISCGDQTTITDQDYKAIYIALVGPITAGTTYQVNSTTNNTLGYTETAGDNDVTWDTGDCENATGSITVTSISDTKIEGTFTFTGSKEDACSSQKTVTNGKFRGTFQSF